MLAQWHSGYTSHMRQYNSCPDTGTLIRSSTNSDLQKLKTAPADLRKQSSTLFMTLSDRPGKGTTAREPEEGIDNLDHNEKGTRFQKGLWAIREVREGCIWEKASEKRWERPAGKRRLIGPSTTGENIRCGQNRDRPCSRWATTGCGKARTIFPSQTG